MLVRFRRVRGLFPPLPHENEHHSCLIVLLICMYDTAHPIFFLFFSFLFVGRFNIAIKSENAHGLLPHKSRILVFSDFYHARVDCSALLGVLVTTLHVPTLPLPTYPSL